MTLYYSDDWRDELIELSDEHLMWYVKIDFEHYGLLYYNELVHELCEEFKEIYDTPLLITGRSGRHVCVKDTPRNRQQLMNMQKTVYRMQNRILKCFDDGWRINKYGTLYNVQSGSVCIGSVDGRDIITHGNQARL